MIASHLNEIVSAGQQMAKEQYPLYIQKQKELQEQYNAALSTNKIKKLSIREQEEDREKINRMSKDRLRNHMREVQDRKHIQRMTRIERLRDIRNVMKRLYYGLDDDMAVPGDFNHLVNTKIGKLKNPTMDKVNRYNIILAMQQQLKIEYPETFSEYPENVSEYLCVKEDKKDWLFCAKKD